MVVDIPRSILPYAEVVVTADEIAHRPRSYQLQTDTRKVWRNSDQTMVDEPVYTFAYGPACDDAQPPVTCMSAGWAAHLDYAGCPACFRGVT